MSLQITMFPINGGRVTTNPPIGPGGTYPEGQKVTVTARPNRGYEFVRWSGVTASTENPTTVVMSDNVSLVAFFTAILPTPTPTRVPTATPTRTPTPTPTATSVPVTFAAFGPTDGVIFHDPDSGTIPIHTSGVTVANTVVEARFFNPYPASEGSWSYGFLLRRSSNVFHSVFVRSNGSWYHRLRTGGVESEVELRRELSSQIDTGPTGSNHLRVIALGENGWLYINGVFVAKLSLSGLGDAGGVEAIGSYFGPDELAGKSTRFEDFSVRSIQREFGPDSATIFDEPGLIGTFESDAVTLADAIVEARFLNPYPTSAGSWSNGFLLRHSASNTFHAVFIRSNREWYHYVRTGTAESSTLLQQTSSTAINTSTGGSNVVRVVVVGNEGWLFINGTFAGALDLSGLTVRGNTTAMTGYFSTDKITGESTRFEDFTVWSY